MGSIKVYGTAGATNTNLDTGARNIYVSLTSPTADVGKDGDLWIQYTA
jgi:hypothetical protein